MAEFDAYLMVDWSAESRPKTGPDSIWYCLLDRNGPQLGNISTRAGAVRTLRDLLHAAVARGGRVLAGFDFPFGYPAGFARTLGLRAAPPWRAVWEEIARLIEDGEDNRNNRFEVAAALNRRISGGPFPFWGCPRRQVSNVLSMTKPAGYSGRLAEYRLADRATAGPQPVWKLCYAGSAGSQALVGIPCLLRLRDDPLLAPVSRVWPFETGFRPPRRRGALIAYAEIYPSMVKAPPDAGLPKDAAQVLAAARWFAEADARGRVAAAFRPPVPPAARMSAAGEEGWILGTGIGAFPKRS